MSKWLTHVKKTMKSEAGKKSSMGKKWFTHVLKTAKKTYHKKGGADDSPSDEEAPAMADAAVPAAGRRRGRKGGKTVRRGRK
jgi:hypothetical protein